MRFPEDFSRDFSILDSYNYENKSSTALDLDRGLFLIRNLLGGKRVCLITKDMKAVDTHLRALESIALLVLTVCAPLASAVVVVGSLALLGFKVLYVKYSSEIKAIEEQFKKNHVLKNFDELAKKHDHSATLALYKLHPAYFNETNRATICSQSSTMLEFKAAATKEESYDLAMKLYHANPFIAQEPGAKDEYDKVRAHVLALFQKADDLLVIRMYSKYPLSDEADLKQSYDEAVKRIQKELEIDCNELTPEQTYNEIVNKVKQLFEKAKENVSYKEVIGLYAKYPFVREQANAHKAYQEAIVNLFKSFKKEEEILKWEAKSPILRNTAKLLSLIPDSTLITAAISEILSDCLDKEYLCEQTELAKFFKKALPTNDAVITSFCQTFVNTRPNDDEVNAVVTSFHQNSLTKATDLKDLLNILLISDITSILEEMPESNISRALIFANVQNFSKDDAEKIRKSIRQELNIRRLPLHEKQLETANQPKEKELDSKPKIGMGPYLASLLQGLGL